LYLAELTRLLALDLRTKRIYFLSVMCGAKAIVFQERQANVLDAHVIQRLQFVHAFVTWPPGLLEIVEGYARRVMPRVLLALDEGGNCIVSVPCVTRDLDGRIGTKH